MNEHGEGDFGGSVVQVAEPAQQDMRVQGIVELDEVPQSLHGVVLEGLQHVKEDLAGLHSIEAGRTRASGIVAVGNGDDPSTLRARVKADVQPPATGHGGNHTNGSRLFLRDH